MTSSNAQCDSSSSKRVVCNDYGSSGQLVQVSRYKNQKRHGVWEYYDEGELKSKVRYRKGERRMSFLYKEGEIVETINRNGKVKKRSNCDC